MGIGKRHSGSGIRGSVLLPSPWRRDPLKSNALVRVLGAAPQTCSRYCASRTSHWVASVRDEGQGRGGKRACCRQSLNTWGSPAAALGHRPLGGGGRVLI